MHEFDSQWTGTNLAFQKLAFLTDLSQWHGRLIAWDIYNIWFIGMQETVNYQSCPGPFYCLHLKTLIYHPLSFRNLSVLGASKLFKSGIIEYRKKCSAKSHCMNSLNSNSTPTIPLPSQPSVYNVGTYKKIKSGEVQVWSDRVI